MIFKQREAWPDCCCIAHRVSDTAGGCCPGWLHMDDSCGRGPGIERCDDCDLYDTDEDAQRAHDQVCACGLTVATSEAISTEDQVEFFSAG